MNSFLRFIFLSSVLLFVALNGCADFVFILGTNIQSETTNDNSSVINSIESLSSRLKIDSGLHRVGVATLDSLQSYDFDLFQNRNEFLNFVTELNSINNDYEIPFKKLALDDALEHIIKNFVGKQRRGIPLVAVLIDDGTAAFSTKAEALGKFSEFLRKHHYVHFYIVSLKAERLKNVLLLSDNEVILISTKAQELNALKEFITCDKRPISLKNSFNRRNPIPLRTQQAALTFNDTYKRIPFRSNILQKVVANRNAFDLIQKRHSTTLSSLTTPASIKIKAGCQMDIVFLMDCSGGTSENRQKYLNLAIELVRVLNIDSIHGAQVALIRYSGPGRSDTAFHLKKHQNSEAIIKELKSIGPLGGTTRTAEALLYAKHEFEEKFGGRAKAERVLILFTDGYSQDEPKEASLQLRREIIHIYTIAVKNPDFEPNLEQLKLIATDKQSSFLDSEFNTLKQKFSIKTSRCK